MRKHLTITLALFFVIASISFAQVQTGNIYGTVVDENNLPVPGVTVTLLSDQVGKIATITTAKGVFRFLSLPPGKYSIIAELAAFSTVKRKNITVSVGSNVTLKIKMVPKTLKEEIVVKATPPVIDTRKTTTATNLTSEELQALPTARDPFVIMELTPGVVMDRENVGGSETGQQSNFVSRGVGRMGANWNMDGVNVTDQISVGAAPQYYDFDSFEEIQIQTAANDISAFSAGVQINFVTKRGSNKFFGGGRTYITSEKFQSENMTSELEEAGLEQGNKINYIGDYGLNIGGPIKKDKIWFWIGGAYQDIRKYLITGDLQKQVLRNFETKINLSLGKHRIETFFNWSNKTVNGRQSHSPLDAWESRYNQTGPHPFFKLQDEITASDTLFLSTKASYFGGGFKLEPIGPIGGIAIYDRALDRYLGTYRMSDYQRPQYFAQFQGNYYKENIFGADHEFKFGVEYKYSPGRRTRIYYSQRLYYKDYEAHIPYRAYFYRNSDYDYVLYRLGTFFQDTISFKKLTIIAGMRLDRQSGWVNELKVDGTHVDWAGEYNLPAVTVPKTDLNFAWNTFQPRFGLIYDISGNGKMLFKFNIGLYSEHMSSDFLYNLASTYGYGYTYWNDANGDGAVQPDEIGKIKLKDYFKILSPDKLYDKDLSSPRLLEITTGLEKEIFENFSAGANIIYRKHYNSYWTLYYINDNGTLRLPQPDDWVIGGYIPEQYGGYAWWELRDGLERSTQTWMTNRPDYYTRYLAFEIRFKKRPTASSKLMLDGSFTYQDWRRFYPTTASYNDPTGHKPVDLYDGKYAGYISSSSGASNASMNPRWMTKIGFVYQFPYNINFGGTFIVRDGYILPKHYVDMSVTRNGIDDNPSVMIAEYGTYRLPTFYMLNLRIERMFRVKNAKLYLTLDGFNIFNANTILAEEYQVTAKNYGAPLQIMNPRIFRLGIRFKF